MHRQQAWTVHGINVRTKQGHTFYGYRKQSTRGTRVAHAMTQSGHNGSLVLRAKCKACERGSTDQPDRKHTPGEHLHQPHLELPFDSLVRQTRGKRQFDKLSFQGSHAFTIMHFIFHLKEGLLIHAHAHTIYHAASTLHWDHRVPDLALLEKYCIIVNAMRDANQTNKCSNTLG